VPSQSLGILLDLIGLLCQFLNIMSKHIGLGYICLGLRGREIFYKLKKSTEYREEHLRIRNSEIDCRMRMYDKTYNINQLLLGLSGL